jgi:D-psicose/D-tagatose/L-ribulose 3-epimerase
MSKSNLLPVALSVSSLAWEPNEDATMARALKSRGITFIDLVPTKYFSWDDPSAVKKSSHIRREWAEFGIQIRGMQSLLFGVGPLNILNTEDWPALELHFERVFLIASTLGVDRIVFGSPANRKKNQMELVEAESLAKLFFYNLAEQAEQHACLVLLEPNPKEYDCDFITSTPEAASLVQLTDHPNLKVQLDLGTCFYNSEQSDVLFQSLQAHIGYIHLATKNLDALQGTPNPQITSLLKILPEQTPISIEMKSVGKKGNTSRVNGSLDWIEENLSFLMLGGGDKNESQN